MISDNISKRRRFKLFCYLIKLRVTNAAGRSPKFSASLRTPTPETKCYARYRQQQEAIQITQYVRGLSTSIGGPLPRSFPDRMCISLHSPSHHIQADDGLHSDYGGSRYRFLLHKKHSWKTAGRNEVVVLVY